MTVVFMMKPMKMFRGKERTQILMDLTNKTGGIMIGTGDLSELALGWTTYNEIICQCIL